MEAPGAKNRSQPTTCSHSVMSRLMTMIFVYLLHKKESCACGYMSPYQNHLFADKRLEEGVVLLLCALRHPTIKEGAGKNLKPSIAWADTSL